MIKAKKVPIILAELKRLFPQVVPSLNYSNPWEFLFAVIMSAQTTDKQVNKLTASLFQKYKSLNDYANANPEVFEHDLSSIGLYRSKAKNILATARLLVSTYHGDVPATMKDLLSLPGVGRKTANVILGNLFNKPVGIAVDTHVMRISQLYGLTSHSEPVKIEQDLVKIIPKNEWTNFTHRVIAYGRTYCPAQKHNHAVCPITKILQFRV